MSEINDNTTTDSTDEAILPDGTDDSLGSSVDEEVILPDDELEVDAETDEDEAKPASDAEEDSESEATEEDTDSEDPEGESDKPSLTEDEQKEIARQKFAERKAQREQEEAQQDYMQTLKDEAAEQRQKGLEENDVNARMQAIETERAIEKIQLNQKSLLEDSQKAMTEIDVFNPESEGYIPGLYEEVLQDFDNTFVQSTKRDNGQEIVLGAFNPKTGDPQSLYEYARKQADRFAKAANKGALEGQQNAKKNFAKAETPTTRAPKEGKKDAFMDGFDSDTDY